MTSPEDRLCERENPDPSQVSSQGVCINDFQVVSSALRLSVESLSVAKHSRTFTEQQGESLSKVKNIHVRGVIYGGGGGLGVYGPSQGL